jgi:hypothetical protein
MIKETSILEEIQAIRRVLMVPENDTKLKSQAVFIDYMRERHKIGSLEDLKKSEIYVSLSAHPAMKHILEYLELG